MSVFQPDFAMPLFSGRTRPGLIEATVRRLHTIPRPADFRGGPAPASLKHAILFQVLPEKAVFPGRTRPGLIEACQKRFGLRLNSGRSLNVGLEFGRMDDGTQPAKDALVLRGGHPLLGDPVAAFRAPSYPRWRRPDAAFNSEAPLLLAPLRRGATTSLSPPHSTSAPPGGRFRIGRGQASLPPEFPDP